MGALGQPSLGKRGRWGPHPWASYADSSDVGGKQDETVNYGQGQDLKLTVAQYWEVESSGVSRDVGGWGGVQAGVKAFMVSQVGLN